ncbi:TPA: hypothetical protein ACH3X2_010219 [Trebouxia sp. C0005]
MCCLTKHKAAHANGKEWHVHCILQPCDCWGRPRERDRCSDQCHASANRASQCQGHSGTSRTDGKIPRGSGFLLCRGCWVLTGALLASEKLCRIRLVPFSAVLGVIVGLLVVFTSLPWFLGKGKLLQADSRYTCKARGGLDPFSQLGDLNGFQHQIYTASKLAQHLFNTGLLLEWNFNQAEALRAFKLASEADPTAAMPYWGITYALGPGANRDVTEDRQPYPSFCPADFELAESAAKTALQLASKAAATDPTSLASQQDLAFAEAASQRFAAGSALGPARTAAEEEYAKALLDIGRTFNNTKALAIAAESYMNLSPWDYYAQPDVLRPSATKAEALLTEVLQEDLDNPLALHLHIHISEASTPSRSVSTAGRGEPSADRLTGQGPGATLRAT